MTAEEFLAAHHVATIATNGNSGIWAAAVFYVNREHALYFQSSRSSRHARNIADDARVAVTIQPDIHDWRKIRGLQMSGICRELSVDHATLARRLYVEKFKFLEESSPADGSESTEPETRDAIAIQTALEKTHWYEIKPICLYYIDNSVHFGHRETIIPAG